MNTSPQKKQRQKRKIGYQALPLCSRRMLTTMGSYSIKTSQDYKYRIDVVQHQHSKFMKIIYENPQCIFTTYEIKQAHNTQWFYAITKYSVSLRRIFNVMEFNPKVSLHIFAAMIQQIQKVHNKNLYHRVIEPRNALIVKNAKIRFSKYYEAINKNQPIKEKLYHTSLNQIERNPYIHPILKGDRLFQYHPAHCDVFSIVICFLDFFFKGKIMPNLREANTRNYFYDNSKLDTNSQQRRKKQKIQNEWKRLAQKEIDKQYLVCGGLQRMFMELFMSDKQYSLKDLQNNSFYQNHVKLMNQVDFFKQLVPNSNKEDQNSGQEDDPIVKKKQYTNLRKTETKAKYPQKSTKSKLTQSEKQFFIFDKNINLSDIFIKEELLKSVIQSAKEVIQKLNHHFQQTKVKIPLPQQFEKMELNPHFQQTKIKTPFLQQFEKMELKLKQDKLNPHFQQTKIKIPFLQQFEKMELKLKQDKLYFDITTQGLSLQNLQQKSFLYSLQIKVQQSPFEPGYCLKWGQHKGDSRVIEKMEVFIQSFIYKHNRKLQLKMQNKI